MKALVYAALIALVPTLAVAQGESGSNSMNRIQGSGDSGSGTLGSENDVARPQPGGGMDGANGSATIGRDERIGPSGTPADNPTAPRQQP